MNCYQGYSYPALLSAFIPVWKRLLCSRGWHLWDEVWSVREHYLQCDACKTVLHISKVEKPPNAAVQGRADAGGTSSGEAATCNGLLSGNSTKA